MNVDAILQAFVLEEANVILIGGMNFLLRHQPVMTFDVDLWVRDDEANLDRVARALCRLEAAWGRDEHSWKPVPADGKWLRGQTVFCLTTREGAVDIFTEVKGLEGKFTECWQRSRSMTTGGGIPFRSLSDEDMLACQLALPAAERRRDRVDYLSKHGRKEQ